MSQSFLTSNDINKCAIEGINKTNLRNSKAVIIRVILALQILTLL